MILFFVHNRFQVVTETDKSSLKVNRAIQTDAGEYQAVLQNKFGKDTFTIKVIVLDKPGPIQDLKVAGVTEKTVSLKWSEPESDGGSDITGYIVEERETARSTWSKVWLFFVYIQNTYLRRLNYHSLFLFHSLLEMSICFTISQWLTDSNCSFSRPNKSYGHWNTLLFSDWNTWLQDTGTNGHEPPGRSQICLPCGSWEQGWSWCMGWTETTCPCQEPVR